MVKVVCFDRLLQVFILKGLRNVMEVEGLTERCVLFRSSRSGFETRDRLGGRSDGTLEGLGLRTRGQNSWRASVNSSTWVGNHSKGQWDLPLAVLVGKRTFSNRESIDYG